jgi:hypothetical protein
MKLTHSWHAGSFRLNMPSTFLTVIAALTLTVGVAQAQSAFDISNQDSVLTNSDAWTPSNGAPPGTHDTATWDSHDVTTGYGTSLKDNFTTAYNTTWGSIAINSWNGPISINTTNSYILTLTGNPVVNTTGTALSIGNLDIDPSSGSGASLDLVNSLTITKALGTAAGTTTNVTVDDGGPLNLIGNSNAGQVSTGIVNLAFQNNSNFSFGNNTAQTFGKLTVTNDNTTLTLDYNAKAYSYFGTGNAITAKTAETFTGALTINSGAKLTIDGWQGQLGHSGTDAELFFANTGQSLDTEVKDVAFDLATNQAGPTGSTYDSVDGSSYDYGMWITDPSNSSLYELVPYAAVPEPKTILAGLALLGALGWRERRRLTVLHSRLFPQPESI